MSVVAGFFLNLAVAFAIFAIMPSDTEAILRVFLGIASAACVQLAYGFHYFRDKR